MQRLTFVDPSGGNMIQDGDFKISSPGMQHYGSAQKYITEYVSNSRRLPVPNVLWTALEIKADEDGRPIYGPKLPGRALTSMCIPWFTAVLHLDVIAKREKGMVVKSPEGLEILERKLYLQPHYPSDNPTGKFAAKVSGFGQSGPPHAVIDASFNIFFDELAEAKKKQREALQKGSE